MTTFTFCNVEYIDNGKGYYYRVQNGKKARISKEIYDEALYEYTRDVGEQAEVEEAKAEQKKAKKAKRAKKNIAYKLEIDGEEITLTEKQRIFFENIPNDQYYDGKGENAALWTDAYCDTLADIMNSMVVGAIISTLREKNLITVGEDKVNGKKCKFFALTDLGKAIFRDMGL